MKLMHVWPWAALTVAAVASCDPEPQPKPVVPPRVGRIVCDGGTVTTTTPVVEVQADGVHLVIENQGPSRRYYIRPGSDGPWNHGGPLRSDEEEVTTTMPPGEVLVGCFGSVADIPNEGTSERFASLTVVDPRSLWVEPRLPCEADRAGQFVDSGAFDGPADADSIIRRVVPGVSETDQLVHPGYPDTAWHAEARLLVRDGKAVAQFAVYEQQSRWQVAVWRCPGAVVGAAV